MILPVSPRSSAAASANMPCQKPDPQPQRVKTDRPDLVIDGGKGQLSSVVAVLQEMNLMEDLRVVSLYKQREEIFLPGESATQTDPEQPGCSYCGVCGMRRIDLR